MTVGLFFLLGALAIIIYILIRSIDLGKGIVAFISDEALPVYLELFPRSLPADYEQFLYRNEKYYRDLSGKLQRSYASRVMKFIADKDFQTREDLKLTREMVLVIASAAVKITFGLRDYKFSTFHTIIIYPDEFFSKVIKHQVKGETNATGVIIFSWKDLQFGNSISDDSINLGYHEFAHALFLHHLMYPYEDEFKIHYRKWLVYIKNNSSLARVTGKNIFREYAAANEMEFFAVALENFFEKPDFFKKEIPDLYAHMTQILNQDLAKK